MLDAHLGTQGPPARAETFGDLMLAEHAHRVANDMTIVMAELRTCRSRSRNVAVQDVLAASIERLDNICDVQRRLMRPGEGAVDLDVVLGGLAEAVVLARADPREVDLVLRLPSLRVESRCAWRLATIVAELLTNALKHGLAGRRGRVSLAFDVNADSLFCTVADDGVGAGDWQVKGTGHGHLIVQALVEEMGGTIERRTSTLGTEMRMAFPRSCRLDWSAPDATMPQPWKVCPTWPAEIGARGGDVGGRP